MSPPVDTSMSLHPTAMLTQQMGQLSLGSTGAVSKMDFTFVPYEPSYEQFYEGKQRLFYKDI